MADRQRPRDARPARGVDLTFATHLAASADANIKSKLH
jgi:hypothetical protein